MTPTEGLTRSAIARHCGVAPTTLDKWVLRGCPVHGVGRQRRFVIAEIEAWRAARQPDDEPAVPGDPAPTVTLTEARRRKALADAELAEYALAEKKREVIPIEEAVELLTREFSRVRAKLLALPTKLAALVAAGSDQVAAKEAIEREIAEVLNELSSGPNLPGSGGNGRAPSPH